jgi:anti-anti-sigma factor
VTSAAESLSGTLRVEGVVVHVVGEIDLETAPFFTGLLDEARDLGTGTVTVDLAGVTFMDARALSALVHAARDLEDDDRRLAVQSVPAGLRRLFHITELTGLLAVEAPVAGERTMPALLSAAAAPLTLELLDVALDVVVTMAQAVVVGADGASITLPRQGRLGTVAASNDVVREMDTDQYDTGEGPCLDAATRGARFHITSLDAEQRWPEFVPRARARGIRSILSTPLMGEGTALGALNIYSRSVDAFAEHEQQWADTFAAGAAAVVTRANRGLTGRDAEARLLQALESREVISLAQGITMARVGGTPAQAHKVLRDVGLRTGESLVDVCRNVVTAGSHTTPRTSPPGGEHGPRAG